MTARIRRFRRFATYFLLLAVASVLSFFGQKRTDSASEHSLIPPIPTAHADVISGGDGGVDANSSACATASVDSTCSSGAACSSASDSSGGVDGSDGGVDGSDGSGGDGGGGGGGDSSAGTDGGADGW